MLCTIGKYCTDSTDSRPMWNSFAYCSCYSVTCIAFVNTLFYIDLFVRLYLASRRNEKLWTDFPEIFLKGGSWEQYTVKVIGMDLDPSAGDFAQIVVLDWILALYKFYYYYYFGWLGSRVVSVLDSGAEGSWFKLQPRHCWVTVLGKLFTPIVALFTKQRNW